MFYFNGKTCVEELTGLPPAGATLFLSIEECGRAHFAGKVDIDLINARKQEILDKVRARKEAMQNGTAPVRKPCDCGKK